MTEASLQQFLRIDSDTTLTGLTAISGTLNSSSRDDRILINGDRDFSDVTFTNIDRISLDDGSSTRQTLGANNATAFGTSLIEGFEQGTESTTDVFDYKSALVSPADGTTSISGSSDLTITSITSTSGGAAAISGNTSGVLNSRIISLWGVVVTPSTYQQHLQAQYSRRLKRRWRVGIALPD